MAALAVSLSTDRSLAGDGGEPSYDKLATAVRGFRWHVALESLRYLPALKTASPKLQPR